MQLYFLYLHSSYTDRMLIKSKLGKQKEAVNDEETSESGETIEDPLPAQICKSVVCYF